MQGMPLHQLLLHPLKPARKALHARLLARGEGLQAHARAAEMRLKN